MEFYFKATSASNLECETDNECSSEEVCVNGLCNFKRSLVVTEYRGKNTICEVDDDCGPCGRCNTWEKTCVLRYNGTSCTVDNKDGQCFLGECFPKGCDDNTPCKGRNEYCASPNNSSEKRFLEGESGACVYADFQKYPIEGTYYYVSTSTMFWWDAEAACHAIGKIMVSAKELLTEKDGSECKGKEGSYKETDLLKSLQPYTNNFWVKERVSADGSYFGAVYNNGIYFDNYGGSPVFALCK